MIYLDANATTPMHPEVLEAMMPYLTDCFHNPSSPTLSGRRVRKAIDRAREQVAALIGAEAKQITFTSGGTEANNLALRSMVHRHKAIITSAIEHPAVLNPCQDLAQKGHPLTVCEVDPQGYLNLEKYRTALASHPSGMSSVMWANNETGAIQPIAEIAELTRSAGWTFHTDAIQAAGKLAVDVRETPVGALSLSAHKFHGPKGIGALYSRSGDEITPSILGGGQEKGARSGTEHVAGIIGMGKAAEMAQAALLRNEPLKGAARRDAFLASLQENIPGLRLHSSAGPCLWNVINLSVEGCFSAALRILLDDAGLVCSAGSACMTGSHKGSHVLEAMGVAKEEAAGALRLSLSLLNTSAELETAVNLITTAVAEVRRELQK
ncbi:cysteine desulfurase family protein [Verrucomicrobiaceae bacterium 227]